MGGIYFLHAALVNLDMKVLEPEVLNDATASSSAVSLAMAACEYSLEKKRESAKSDADNATVSSAGEPPFWEVYVAFDDKSRYRNASTYAAGDVRGRCVRVVSTPAESNETVLGCHRRQKGQRLDQLAGRVPGQPDALSQVDKLAISTSRR